MKRLPTHVFVLASGLLAACGQVSNMPEPSFADIDAANAAAGELGSRLKGELMAALQEGGPTGAIEVCAERAPAIALTISEQTGYDISRTSAQTRNPANTADAWEQGVLKMFEEALQSGVNPKFMEHSEVVLNADGSTDFRWMKPIFIEEPCTVCHGGNVSTDVKAQLAEWYPDDLATGYAVGDLRGAFTVRKPVEVN